MAKYFTLQELTSSAKADAAGIKNVPPPEAVANLVRLMDNLLDPVRALWGKPVTCNSGYRSYKLNQLVGGAVNSSHLVGEAADITTGNAADNKRLFDMLLKSNLVFDQIIDEKNYSWLHVSLKASGNRTQILHSK